MQPAIKSLTTMLEGKQSDLERWDANAQAAFRSWFGTTDEPARALIAQRIAKLQRLLTTYSDASFERTRGALAFVQPRDDRTVYVDEATPLSAATLAHELSHFASVGGTKDYAYGPLRSKTLARVYPEKALRNADNFALYVEE